MITPNMLIVKYKNNKDFIEFVWLFAVPVSWTKAEARELLKSCENYIFEAGQADRQYRQVERGNCWKTEGRRGAQVHCLWKGCFFSWNN